STIGYVFTMAGGPISWSSHVQKKMALSTMEVEYVTVEAMLIQLLMLTIFTYFVPYCDLVSDHILPHLSMSLLSG
ncbi:hypothetical protein ARMSODRAFT_896474, partial [Armillaria solidipes]